MHGNIVISDHNQAKIFFIFVQFEQIHIDMVILSYGWALEPAEPAEPAANIADVFQVGQWDHLENGLLFEENQVKMTHFGVSYH